WLIDGPNHFNSPAQIAVHPVGRADVNFRLPAISKQENPAVLQEPVDDRHDADILTDSRQAGTQSTNAPTNQVDLHAGLARPIQSLNDDRFQHAIDFRVDPPGLARFLMPDLLLDFFHKK